ncbi:hypothetical protein [Streptomyces sp. NPDC001530]|uniref:hypothetical protein n=1 Tax=Streptomyces sp. NPDC001530 TaxID=3364582 RepID=UPI003673AE34
MTSAMARGLAAAAVIVALVATAACKNDETGGGSTQQTAPQPTGTEETGSQETGSGETTPADAGATLASLFPGSDSGGGSASAIHVPTAKVGEPAGGKVDFVSTTNQPMTLQDIVATTDTGETSITQDGCSGVEVPPGGSCQVELEHTASEPGPFTGQLTAVTSEGSTITATISGEAVGSSTTGSYTPESTTPPAPTTSNPVPSDSETTELPTPLPDDTNTDTPEPDIS